MARIGAIDPSVVQTNLLATVEATALPAIAWGWDMLGPLWDTRATDAERRAYLLEVAALQGRRGTPWSVRTALDLLGWPDATILERQMALRYDGAANFDGYWWYGTGVGEWYEWGVELEQPLAAGFSSADLAVVSEVAQYFGPLRARMVRVVLHLADIATTGGGAPTWTGGTALDRVGLWDGTTWHTRAYLSRDTTVANHATFRWRQFGLDCPDPSTITKVGLLRADGSVYAEQVVGAIHKTAGLEMYGTWTISW